MDWKRFFDGLGMNGTRWQWRIMRWQDQWAERKASWGQKKQHVTYRHKFCRCGKLLDRNEKVCPHCGARAPSWRAQATARAVGLVMPTACIGTPLLLLANVGAMLGLMFVYGGKALFNPTPQQLYAAGGLAPLFLEGAYWRLITYGYLHGGFLHIAFNMFALSQVGPLLEKEIGTARFFTLYTLALLGGSVAHLLVRGGSPVVMIGASGALFGLIGFGLSYAHFTGGPSGNMWRGFFLRWAMYGFIFGFMIGAANTAHAGGFVVGLALGFLVERERLNRDALTPVWRVAAGACLLATVGAVILQVLRGG
jgi:rhomboid protease GluP